MTPPRKGDADGASKASRSKTTSKTASKTTSKTASSSKKTSSSKKASGTKKAAPTKKASGTKKAPAKKAPSKTSSKKAPAKKPAGSPPADWGPWLRTQAILVAVGVALGLVLTGLVLALDARHSVRVWLDTPPAAAPTTVWSAPMRIRVGERVVLDDLTADLLEAGYERAASTDRDDTFSVQGTTVTVRTGAVDGVLVDVPSGTATLRLSGDRVLGTDPAAGVVLRPTRLATLGDAGSRRTPVTLDTVSPWMVPALLAIEDTRFRDHVGIDPIGILRALWHNLRGADGLHGGSTLTQQLAKNLFLGRERTVRRKLREVFHAAALEAELDKDQLLELYLSEVYLGHVDGVPLHGVEQASRAWFGKSAAHLTVAEAASVAGTIAAPNLWSPLRDPDAALNRRETVLRRMAAVRALTEAQLEAALDAPLATVAPPAGARWRLPWAVAAALKELDDRLGDGGGFGDGARIHTTVQPHHQRAAQAAVLDGVAALGIDGAEAALVEVDAASGRVLAVVGGTDHAARPFHRAVDAVRQPGSVVKPLLVAALADADPDVSTATRFEDAPLERRTSSGTWRPGNHDGVFDGPVTLADALARSRNVPFVLVSEQIGRGRLRDVLVTAGLEAATELPSAALGAFDATPWQVAEAYTLFPNGGHTTRAHVVEGVSDAAGAARYRAVTERTDVVGTPAITLTNRMLRQVVEVGTGRGLRAHGVTGAWGGKTGTTDGARDAWFAAVDGTRAVVAWVGKDREPLGRGGSAAALPVVARHLVATGDARQALPLDEGLAEAEVCLDATTDVCAPPRRCAVRGAAWFQVDHVPDCRHVDVVAEEGEAVEAPRGPWRLFPRRDKRP